MIPFKSGVQKGDGQIHSGINSSKEFEATLQRARLALLGQGFLKSSDDIVYTLELTEAEYIGTSIGLAGAVSIYSAAKGVVIDPYAAFTGDIIPDHQEWRVRGIRGIRQKLEAARHNGCRRIFIPRENQEEMDSTAYKTLQIIPVDTLIEVFLQLQTPFQPLRGDSIQVRKINELRAFCQDQGWDLSQPQTIQHGLQFHVAPLIFPELSLNVFNTGTHTPKQHNIQEYQQLLKNLELLEKPKIPIRKVEQTLKIQNSSVQKEIMVALEQLQPTERRQEPHCEYAFKFGQEQEHLVVKQYQKGSLQFQGTAGELYKTVLECVVSRYNLHYPKAQISVEALLQPKGSAESTSASPQSLKELPLPHIGTDESGKGDYFGPMVIAGVFVDAQIKPKLEALGVKDSKCLSDKKCRELASQIREICRGKCEEVEIPPERYNELYETFRSEGKNLNHLLAWGHARAVESLLERFSCTHAVADQFGDEQYIRSRLMEKGKQLHLIQLPKGEQYLAVAAASILARDRFLARLDKFAQEYGFPFPKGASDTVVSVGRQVIERKNPSELRKVAKLHHKTTWKITREEKS